MAKQKRGNDYFLKRLEAEHPRIFADWRAGKYPSARKASEAAGLRKATDRLSVLKNAWRKATAKERADFLAWTAFSLTTSFVGRVIDASRCLNPAAAARIRTIMDRRSLAMGDLMDEIGLKRLDASLGNALSKNTRLRPEMAKRLEKWLDDNSTI